MKMATANYRRSVKQGKRLNSQSKEIIMNVYKYFDSLSKKSTSKYH